MATSSEQHHYQGFNSVTSDEQQQQVQPSSTAGQNLNHPHQHQRQQQQQQQHQWPTMKRYFKKHLNKAVVECKHQASFTARRLVGQLRTLDKKARQRMHATSAEFAVMDHHKVVGKPHQRSTSSQQRSYDLNVDSNSDNYHQSTSSSSSGRPILCNVNNPLRNSRRRCKITASVQSYLSHHQYHHYYHPKSHHLYLQAQKRKSLSRNSSFRMSITSSSNRHRIGQSRSSDNKNSVGSTTNNNNNSNSNKGSNDEDDDDDDFGWGSDFDDDSSSNSSTMSSSTINNNDGQIDENEKSSHDVNHVVNKSSSSSGFMRIGKPIKNQRIIEDVIQDRGTIGNFKNISSDCYTAPTPIPPSSSYQNATLKQNHNQSSSSTPLVIVTNNDDANSRGSQQKHTVDGEIVGLRSILNVQLKHELNKRKITEHQPPKTEFYIDDNANNSTYKTHDLSSASHDTDIVLPSSDHEWEEDTELDQEDDDDDEEDIKSLKARQGFKQIKEKLEAIMDQRLAIYKKSMSTPTLQHSGGELVHHQNDHSTKNSGSSGNNKNSICSSAIKNNCQDTSDTSPHSKSINASRSNHYLSSSLIIETPPNTTNTNNNSNNVECISSSEYNHSLSSSSYDILNKNKHNHQMLLVDSKYLEDNKANSILDVANMLPVPKSQSSSILPSTTNQSPQTLLTTAIPTSDANIGCINNQSLEEHSESMDECSEMYDNSRVMNSHHQHEIDGIHDEDHGQKHHHNNVQRDFDQQSHCSSTGSQSSGSQDSGHGTHHSSSNNSELGLKTTSTKIMNSTTEARGHHVLAANIHHSQQQQQQQSPVSTRNPPVEPPSSPSSTVSSNDSGNSSACYATTSGSSSSASDIHLINSSSIRSSKNLDDLYDVVDEAMNHYNLSNSSCPSTHVATTKTHNVANLTHYNCCLDPSPKPSALSPPLIRSANNKDKQQHIVSNNQRPLFNTLTFSKQIQNGIKNLRNNVVPTTLTKNSKVTNENTSDIVNKSLHNNNNNAQIGPSNHTNLDKHHDGIDYPSATCKNDGESKIKSCDQSTITVIKREFNVNHQQAMVEELMYKLNKRNQRMVQRQQQNQEQHQASMDANNQDKMIILEPDRLSTHYDEQIASCKSDNFTQVPTQLKDDIHSEDEKRLSLLLEQQRQMSLKLQQKPRTKRKTYNGNNSDSYRDISQPATVKSTSDLISSSCDIGLTEKQQQQQKVSGAKSATSLRQHIKNVVDDIEQPNKLSTLTMHVLNRSDSFNSDLAISDGVSLSRSISSSSLSSLSSLDNSHRSTTNNNIIGHSNSNNTTTTTTTNNNIIINEKASSHINNSDHSEEPKYLIKNRFDGCNSRNIAETNSGRQLSCDKPENAQYDIAYYNQDMKDNNSKINKDKSTISHYLKSLKEFNIPTKFKMPKVKLLAQAQQTKNYNCEESDQYRNDSNNLHLDADANQSNEHNENRRGLFSNGSSDGLANHFVTISNRRWKSCHLKSNKSDKILSVNNSQIDHSNYQQDEHDYTEINGINNNQNVQDQTHHYYAMNSPMRPTLNRLTYFLPESQNGISPTTQGTYQPENYNVM